MLVLSRQVNEKITLPELGVSFEILRVQGNRVRIGIQAPESIRVLRDEILPGEGGAFRTRYSTAAVSREMLHELKNQVNAVCLALRLFQRQQRAGQREAADATLDRLFDHLSEFESETSRLSVGTGYRALLVEDDDYERELLAGLLRLSGYDVATTNDGVDALDYLKTNDRPDIVLLDMQMPRCDGRETIEAIRQDRSMTDLPVYAVSAQDPSEYGVPTGANGVDGWFAKPVNADLLTRRIRSILRASASA